MDTVAKPAASGQPYGWEVTTCPVRSFLQASASLFPPRSGSVQQVGRANSRQPFGLRLVVLHSHIFLFSGGCGSPFTARRHYALTMNEARDQQQIREVIATWMRATSAGDLAQVLSLMAEDVIFLVAGQPPMQGRDAFAAAFRTALQHVRIEGASDIQEIRIAGDHAFCWSHLSMTITPLQGGSPKRRAGYTLSVFRKESDGRWVLIRDANLLSDT